jgi:hypothetical protein
MNFSGLFKAFEAAMALREVAKRFSPTAPAPEPANVPPVPSAVQGFAGQLESRLTGVLVAALKEAFDRDHARLELERAQLDEERRRAEQALRQELRRQAADRELSRLRLLAGASLVGWIASVAIFATGLAGATTIARVMLAMGWVSLLGALAAAFSAQGRVGGSAPEGDRSLTSPVAHASLWLLIAGLAVSAFSLLF